MQVEVFDFVFTIRVFLGLVFLTSGAGKLLNQKKFSEAVQEYSILPPFLSRAYGIFLPWAEMIVGIGLLAGIALYLMAVSMSVLLVGFIVAIVVNLRRGRTLECHCYGVLSANAIGWGTVLRDILLLMLAVTLALNVLDDEMSLSVVEIWRHELTLLASADSWIPVVLLVSSGFVILRLCEQGTDIWVRLHQLRSKPEALRSELVQD